jgi:hypothetical protein
MGRDRHLAGRAVEKMSQGESDEIPFHAEGHRYAAPLLSATMRAQHRPYLLLSAHAQAAQIAPQPSAKILKAPPVYVVACRAPLNLRPPARNRSPFRGIARRDSQGQELVHRLKLRAQRRSAILRPATWARKRKNRCGGFFAFDSLAEAESIRAQRSQRAER